MINSIRILSLASALVLSLLPASAAEEVEMLIGGDSATNTLELKAGESAKLVYTQYGLTQGWGGLPLWNPSNIFFDVTFRGKLLNLAATSQGGQLAPLEIPGPATVMIRGSDVLATFKVTRVGIASPPAEVPQEAGSNFDVILEQSSDLVNWTPANPGTYSGTETKRFFRTRIVKKQ